MKPPLAHVIPDDVAERVLGIEIDVVGVLVRPGHRDDELGLGLDLALLGLRIHRQQRDEKQKRDDLQPLEQHHAEGIELLARIITEVLSILLPLENGNDEDLGQVGGEREQFRGRLVEQVVLRLQEDRAAQAG